MRAQHTRYYATVPVLLLHSSECCPCKATMMSVVHDIGSWVFALMTIQNITVYSINIHTRITQTSRRSVAQYFRRRMKGKIYSYSEDSLNQPQEVARPPFATHYFPIYMRNTPLFVPLAFHGAASCDRTSLNISSFRRTRAPKTSTVTYQATSLCRIQCHSNFQRSFHRGIKGRNGRA